jgi:hypothetical protein
MLDFIMVDLNASNALKIAYFVMHFHVFNVALDIYFQQIVYA